MAVNFYIFVSTLAWGLLAFVWTSKTWPNTFIKLFLTTGFIWGLILSLSVFGFLVKVG